jgi:SAM-dependent methyltransferase
MEELGVISVLKAFATSLPGYGLANLPILWSVLVLLLPLNAAIRGLGVVGVNPHQPAEFFDVVVSTEIVEHVLDWRLVINNMRVVLRRGGLFYLIKCLKRSQEN